MAVSNQIVKATVGEPKTISQYLSGDRTKAWLTESLGSESARQQFTSNVIACVSANPDLQKCEFASVISAGLLAASLKLPMSPSLGLCYLVPFEDFKNKRTVATFILG